MPLIIKTASEVQTEATARRRAGLACTPLQLKRALRNAGLLGAAATALAADADLDDGFRMQPAIRRNSPTFAALGDALGLSETQRDTLMQAAAQIET